MTPVCTHLDQVRAVEPRTPRGCEECLRTNGWWVHLRLCLVCGHVGCCDDSPNRHAAHHFHRTRHPIIKSFEPSEDWGWCYVDQLLIAPAPTELARRSTAEVVVRVPAKRADGRR